MKATKNQESTLLSQVEQLMLQHTRRSFTFLATKTINDQDL